MPLFESEEERKARWKREAKQKINDPNFKSKPTKEELEKEKLKDKLLTGKIKAKIHEKGISNLVQAENQTKVLIAQNQHMIELLQIICTAQNTLSGGFAINAQNNYYKELTKLIKHTDE